MATRSCTVVSRVKNLKSWFSWDLLSIKGSSIWSLTKFTLEVEDHRSCLQGNQLKVDQEMVVFDSVKWNVIVWSRMDLPDSSKNVSLMFQINTAFMFATPVASSAKPIYVSTSTSANTATQARTSTKSRCPTLANSFSRNWWPCRWSPVCTPQCSDEHFWVTVSHLIYFNQLHH